MGCGEGKRKQLDEVSLSEIQTWEDFPVCLGLLCPAEAEAAAVGDKGWQRHLLSPPCCCGCLKVVY